MADSYAILNTCSRHRAWFLLGIVVAGHITFNVLFNPLGAPVAGSVEWLMLMSLGVAICQPVLFAGWAVIGPGTFAQRVPLTIATLATVIFAGYITAWNLMSNTRISRDADLLIMSVSIFTAAATVMVPIRKLTRWKIVYQYNASDALVPANQFSLRFLLSLTGGCAVLLGIARGLESQLWLGASSVWPAFAQIFNSIGGTLLVIFPAVTVPLIVLSERASIQILIATPILWGSLSWLAIETAVATNPTEIRSQVAVAIAFVQLGASAAGLISALVLRFGRYRLVTLASSRCNFPNNIS